MYPACAVTRDAAVIWARMGLGHDRDLNSFSAKQKAVEVSMLKTIVMTRNVGDAQGMNVNVPAKIVVPM